MSYLRECEKVLKLFDDVASEAPKAKAQVKDMAEFGLTNIVSQLSGDRPEAMKIVYDWTVAEVFIQFKRNVWKSLNYEAEMKQMQHAKNNQ